jgi:hypothetical protein
MPAGGVSGPPAPRRGRHWARANSLSRLASGSAAAGLPPPVDRGPCLLAPLANRRCVALAGAAGGLLRGPAPRLAPAAHRTRMRGEAKFQADEGGDSRTGPQLSTTAIGCGPSMPQLGQAGELLGRQAPRGPGGRPATERRGAGCACPMHPLPDGSRADTQGFGHLAWRPTLLLEVPGLQAPRFFPGMRCRVHA